MTVGQIAALVVLLWATVVALLHTMSEARSMLFVLKRQHDDNFDQYKITGALVGTVVTDVVLALAYWLVLG